MRNKPILFAIFFAVLFAAGLTEIFLLRFESGEVYPEYSSLRSDPRGTRAFFESLSLVPGVEVRRHMQPLLALKDFNGTLFYLGLSEKSNIEDASKIAAAS